jgi:ankyrin repeat protein
MLLNAGADLESRDGGNKTPLLSLFGVRRISSRFAVQSLLEAGALLSATKDDGVTILHSFLKSSRYISVLELLLKHGTDIESRGENDDTVLHMTLRGYI